MRILPVIMSGGSGTRLWPASTDGRPKQFHALGTQVTMLQDSAARVRGDGFLDPLLICNARHGDLVADQLSAIGVKPADVILEPFGRNTAAVATIAALWAERNAQDALVLLLPADHVIADSEGFRAGIQRAAQVAATHIVTFGIEPEGPETGYGYIQAGDLLEPRIFAIRRFVEKPTRAVAESYLAEGGYSWNAGIFLYSASVFLNEALRLCPDIVEAVAAALDGAISTEHGKLLEHAAFARCPSAPVGVAVMEKTNQAAVLPISVGWADIGSWSELWRYGASNEQDNVVKGEGLTIDSAGSLLWSDGPSISVIGLSNVVVVASQGHVLVLPKDRAQDVKKLVELRKSSR